MGDRPGKLIYVGERDAAGNPLDYFVAGTDGEPVPARDLDEADIARLADGTIALITGPRAGGLPPIYRASRPKAVEAEAVPEPEAVPEAPERKRR